MKNFIFCAVFYVNDERTLQFQVTTDSDEMFSKFKI